MQTMDVVGVINAEGRLDDRQLHHELDARGTAQAEVRSRRNAELPRKTNILRCRRELSVEVVETGLVELQGILAKDAVGTAIEKQDGLEGVPDDRNPVLDVSIALRVATRESDGIAEHRHTDGPLGGLADSVQRAGTGDAAELHLGEQELRSIVESGDVRARESILQADSRKREFSDGIAGKERKAGAVLIVVLNELRVDADGLTGEERCLPSLVKLVTAGKNREAGRDRAVKEIGFGESEQEAARKVAELRGKSKSFAETQEVVGLIGKADEAAGQTTDTALQADRLFTLFLELEVDVNRTFFIVALDLRGLVGFDFVEVIELIEAQDAELPETLIEELALVDHQLAADDLVARGGVAAEVDAADEILFLLVEPQRQVDDFIDVVNFGVRLGSEVDESIFAVNFPVGFQSLANFFRGEDIALFERECGLQRVHLKGQRFVRIGADNFERPHMEALALFDVNRDIDGLAVTMSGDERNAKAIALGVNVVEDGFADGHLEISIVTIKAANADFQLLAQLFTVVGLREHGDIPEIKRN